MCALQIELMHLKQMPNINTFCEIKDCALLFMCLHAMCVQKKKKKVLLINAGAGDYTLCNCMAANVAVTLSHATL